MSYGGGRAPVLAETTVSRRSLVESAAVTEHTRAELLTMLRSPDPVERDDVAYLAMMRRIVGGAEDVGLVELGDELARRLTDPEIQARTFAVLLLSEVVARDMQTGHATAEAVLRWRDAFARWYPEETDLRGWAYADPDGNSIAATVPATCW